MNGMTQRAAGPFNHLNPNQTPTGRDSNPRSLPQDHHNGRIALEREPLLCMLR